MCMSIGIISEPRSARRLSRPASASIMGKKPSPVPKKAAVKSIAKPKAKPKAKQLPEKPTATTADDRKNMSGFVTSMKYKQTAQNNKHSTIAQKLLEALCSE